MQQTTVSQKEHAAVFFIWFVLFSILMMAATVLFHFVMWQGILKPFSLKGAADVDHTFSNYPVIVIDAGHGGEDGGASGDHGVLEKDINLKVAQMLSELLSLNGMYPVMTRTQDEMLYDLYSDLQDYTGKKKMYDLRNRLRVAKEAGGTIFISIHMNKFSQESSKGLQVYYSPHHEDSAKLAQTIQGYVRQFLQKENHREIKKASSGIYLLKHIEIPAVLVECGFLSNPEECQKLQDEAYLQQIAVSISSALSEFMVYYVNKG